jgi:hypothetical protein
MRTLRRGTTGPEVALLRRLLNRKLAPSPGLPELNLFGSRYNGAMAVIDFGPLMEAAVKNFQRSKGIPDNGVVDAATWRALGITLDISQSLTLASQPDKNTCYAGAATMLLGPSGGMSFHPGSPPAGTAMDDFWARSFAQQFSWKLEYGMTPMPAAIAIFLQRGAFWFAGDLPFPGGNNYHAVVVGAIWGDGDPDRTMLLFYDPWPVHQGEIYGVILGDYIRSNPTAFRYIIHR